MALAWEPDLLGPDLLIGLAQYKPPWAVWYHCPYLTSKEVGTQRGYSGQGY